MLITKNRNCSPTTCISAHFYFIRNLNTLVVLKSFLEFLLFFITHKAIVYCVLSLILETLVSQFFIKWFLIKKSLCHFGPRNAFYAGQKIGGEVKIFCSFRNLLSISFPMVYDRIILNEHIFLLIFGTETDFLVGQEVCGTSQKTFKLFKISFPWALPRFITWPYFMKTRFWSF